jgi:hypothetical protein
MKKIITTSLIFILVLALSSAVVKKDSSGKAGYTGSPGEPTCSGGGGCHNGGTSSATNVSITASPSFSLNQYYPDSVYTVSVTVNATGFSRFGFGCEVLNTLNVNTGTLQTPGAGVKIINTTRRNMTHSTPKINTNSATFTFNWVAPAAGNANAIFYVCGNAVNGNGNTSGDLPIPYSYTITEGTPPASTVVTSSAKEIQNNVLRLLDLFPNPSSGLTNISYQLTSSKNIQIDLIDLNGKVVKPLLNENQTTGAHSHILNLTDVPKGVYFVKLSANQEKLSQKLIVLN